MKLLFVCMGNICRSPSAENVMRAVLEREGVADQFEIDSAGTINYHVGKPPDPRMTAAGKRRGYAMTGRARQVKAADLDHFDLILAMDEENRADLGRLARSREDNAARIRLFCEFCTRHCETEVPDPYYGGAAGFEKVLDLLEDGCEEIVRRWRAEEL